jgi:hypothetical protein
VISREERIDPDSGLPALPAFLLSRINHRLETGDAVLLAFEFDHAQTVREACENDSPVLPDAWPHVICELRFDLAREFGEQAELFCLGGTILCCLTTSSEVDGAAAKAERICAAYDYLTVQTIVSASGREAFLREHGSPPADTNTRREVPDWVSPPLAFERSI